MLQPASPQPLRLAPPGCLKRIRAIIRFHTFAFGIVVDLHSPHEAKWGDKMIFAWIGPIPSEVLFRQTLPHFAKYQNIVIVFKLLLARLTLLFFCCCIFHSNFPHDGSPSSRKHIQKSNAKQEVVVLPSFIIYFKNPVEYAVHDALNAKKLALQEYVSTTSSKTVFLSIFIDGIKIKPINGLITPPPPLLLNEQQASPLPSGSHYEGHMAKVRKCDASSWMSTSVVSRRYVQLGPPPKSKSINKLKERFLRNPRQFVCLYFNRLHWGMLIL